MGVGRRFFHDHLPIFSQSSGLDLPDDTDDVYKPEASASGLHEHGVAAEELACLHSSAVEIAAIAHEPLSDALERVGQLEAPPDHHLGSAPASTAGSPSHARLRPRPAPSHDARTASPQPRQRRRPLRPQSTRTAHLPRLPPTLRRPDADAQILGLPELAWSWANCWTARSRNSSRKMLPPGGQLAPADTTCLGATAGSSKPPSLTTPRLQPQ